MDTQVEQQARGERHPSVVRKAFAGVVLVIAAALILKFVIGFVIAIFWTVVAVAAVLAIVWALKTIFW
jgi:hypothetical protein